jgi:chitinase
MADNQAQVFQINLTGGVVNIDDFDPINGDQLDFGDISVHGLILGQLEDGTAIITSPWSTSNYIVLEGVRWADLSEANFVPVGNEHLRQDIGGVLSWEQGFGSRDPDTIYVRSHQYGVQERVENFDPLTQKLNFLYLGTRERLSVQDTNEGLLISTEPSGQSLLLVGVQRTDLVAGNLEFHHDQVMEDNLEEPFGFSQDAVSLVSRQELFTPPAPEGASTDGLQVRGGDAVQAAEQVVITEVDHSSHGHDHAMGDHDSMAAMTQPAEALTTLHQDPCGK